MFLVLAKHLDSNRYFLSWLIAFVVKLLGFGNVSSQLHLWRSISTGSSQPVEVASHHNSLILSNTIRGLLADVSTFSASFAII